MKRFIGILLALCLLLSAVPVSATAAETALPRYLYVGGVEVVREYTVGAVTSGEGWRYDVATATLYLTDGADIRYTSTTEDSLENGIYCSNGTLNIHASGTVNITGYSNGIDLPDGSLSLYAAEGANVTITGTGAGCEGISSTVNTNYIRFSGKGTVNVNASDGAAYGMTAAGSIYIDGVTLNVRGTSNYDDISGNNVLIGQTEGAVVNCLGTTCSGIGGTLSQKIGIYNGSIVHLAEKSTEKSWLLGLHAKTIEIADSTLVMDGLTGAYSIYAMHGTSTVSGASHILIRKMVSTEDGAYGLTVDHDPYHLTGEAGYYTRSDAAAEFTPDGDITEIYIGYFELYYPGHLSYHSNGDGTHYYGCPSVCTSDLNGEVGVCNGTATCAAPAFCETCQSSHGATDPQNHDSSVTLVNGLCPYCDVVEAAVDSDGDGYYEIANAGNLYWFAQQVNSGNTAINGELTADIVVNENVLDENGDLNGDGSNFRVWTPIGYEHGGEYIGNFDGGNHTVSGLYFNDSSAKNIGLFGSVGVFDPSIVSTIENIGVVDSWISAQFTVGGIVGEANYTTIQNCYNTGTVIASGYVSSGESDAGGIIGRLSNGGVMINCYNAGKVSGNRWIGGIAGRLFHMNAVINNCYNIGTVSGTESVGGVIGVNYGIATNCYSIGAVSGESYVGELIGQNVYQGNATNCYYLAGSANAGIGSDTAETAALVSTVTEEQVSAASGEDGALIDVLKAWVAEQNDEKYKGWHFCTKVSSVYPTLNYNCSYSDNGETHIANCTSCGSESAEAHTYFYTAEGSSITESCKLCSHSASVYPKLPEAPVYNKNGHEAHCDGDYTNPNLSVLIQYFRCSDDPETEPELLASAPVDAGTYIVRLSVGEASVESTMTISPAPITLLGAEAETRDYDGTPYVTLDTSCGTSGFKVEGILDGDSIEILYASAEVASANAGNYDQVTVKGLTTGGEDGHNYTVVSEATLPIYNIWGNYENSISIYQKGLTIRLSDQQAGSPEALDQNAWEIDADEGLAEGHSIASIKLVAELNDGSTKYASISVEEGSLKIVDAEGNDVTENYHVWAYPATLTITCPDHDEFVQGFCTNCGGYEEATFNEEGYYYEIANAGQLYWFAEYVNNVDGSVAAVLVADIAVPETAPDWTPIGSLSHIYSGSFNGQGHSISGLYVNQPEWDYVGLFGYVGYNPEVKNLTITDSTFIGNHYVGALAGYGEVTASNIAVGENVTVRGNAYAGTMVGYNAGYFSNCFAYSDSFVGYMYSGYGSIENCYFLSETDDEYGTIGKTAAQFASGEVAYLLQAGVPEEDVYDEEWNWIESYIPEVWGQTIGMEQYPVLGGQKVYQVLDCAGNTAYNNADTTAHAWHYEDMGDGTHTVTCANCDYSATEEHTYVEGSCICGATEVVAPTEVTVKISHTVSFDSDLQMNYRIKLSDILAAVPNYVTEGAYLVVEKDRYPMGGGAKTVETVTLYPDLTTDPTRLLFNLSGIQSVEMGSELRAVLHFFDANGNEYYTTVDTYSVLAYAELCFDYYDPATDGYLFTMLIDCLNYGAAAQVAFDRRADEPVNAGLDAYQQYASTELSAELTDVRTYVDNDRSITAVSKMGFSVTFADKTEINAKLTIAEGYTKSDITSVKVLNESGEEVAVLTEFTELDDGRLQVTFTGVKSVNMRDMYYFVACVGDQVASQNVGYSIEAYAKSNIASADANAANLAKACIYYGDSAKIYFDSLLG